MRRACLLACLALAACGPAAEGDAPKSPALTGTARDAAEAEKIAEERALAARFDWEGRFAASSDLCDGGVWDIRRTGIATAGETSCEVRDVRSGAAQVELDLSCTAEGMGSAERWTLTPLPGGGMRVAVRTGAEPASDPIDLVRCD